MFKDILFKWFFKEEFERFKDLELQNNLFETEARLNKNRVVNLEKELFEARARLTNYKSPLGMAELMRESLGLQVDFSAASKDKCKPPHFLEGLEETDRRSFINEMETIYVSGPFNKVVKYMINLFALNAIYKEDKEQMKNGQIAVIAFRTFLATLEDLHKEYLANKKGREDFDEQEIMPE